MRKIFKSQKETKDFAKSFARKFSISRKQRGALVLALVGNLGAGKTTFVQGFLRELGVRSKITSPTFVLIKRYRLKCSLLHDLCFMNAYHIDAYRIKKPKELLDLGIKEILKNPENIVLIEWADRIKKILPGNPVWIKFEHGDKENERLIEVTNFK